MNRLYYGDNLDVLRDHIADASIDLIYLDPPFNSNASYNVLWSTTTGAGAAASIEAFDDTWKWGDAAKDALLDIAGGINRPLQVMMEAMRKAIGENAMMAYLSMMAVRLVELRRVLKPTGSLYLHCDPTASHYLKMVLDAVFGPENFRNELIWKRTSSHSSARRFGPIHDVIFFYSAGPAYVWNGGVEAYDQAYVDRFYRFEDENGRFRLGDLTGAGTRTGESGQPWRAVDPTTVGRHWAAPIAAVVRAGHNGDYADLSVQGKLDRLDELGLIHWPPKGSVPAFKRYFEGERGVAVQDLIVDIGPLSSQAKERLGYPTQKPRALLERLISASSNPDDLVLDPFCGCGTTIDAAQKLDRRWIGIDVTHLAIGLIENRLREGYKGIEFETFGVPKDLASAQRLAADDPHQFQQWICWQVGGFPRDKKGGDKGVDGWFNYLAEGGRIETGVISVKAGNIVNPNMVRDLGRVMERDGHRFGLLLSAALPTRGMEAEAASHPTIETEFGRFPALQIITLAELFQGKKPRLPPLVSPVKKAARVETRASHKPGAQGGLEL